MRVGLISYEFPPETGQGGIGTYVKQAATMLHERGHDVEVFAGIPNTGITNKTSFVNDFMLHQIPCSERSHFNKDVLNIFSKRHTHKKFDIIEGPDFGADSLHIFKTHPEIPHTLRLHTPTFCLKKLHYSRVTIWQKMRFLLGAIKRGKTPRAFWNVNPLEGEECHLAQSLPITISPSRSLAEIISDKWSIPKANIKILPYPFLPPSDLINIPIKQKNNKKIVIAFIGKLEIRKGIIPLCKAIPQVLDKNTNIEFRFIGQSLPSPTARKSMQEYIISELNDYKKNLSFTGPLKYEDIPVHLSEVDICVFPSIWENFPNVCLEAMAAGRAIVASRNGGMSEMLESYRSGILVDPEKPNMIAKKLIELTNNHELRIQLGKNAREKILQTYSYDRIGKQTEDIYNRIIEIWHN